MKSFRYTLEPYHGRASRHTCPGCGKTGEFTRYVEAATGRYLDERVGKCNRLQQCGYHYAPAQYFRESGLTPDRGSTPLSVPAPMYRAPAVSFIPPELLHQSLGAYPNNHFYRFLAEVFGAATAEALVQRYQIGTTDHWPGACVFWQVDSEGRVRTGKVMLYNAQSGKRVKQPYNHVQWIHRLQGLKDFQLQQCLFGEHLLPEEPHKLVGVVEAEKTAVVSAGFYPDVLWLASGGAANLSQEKIRALQGRRVVLFPDLGCYELWQGKAEALSPLAQVSVSDLLEKAASPAQKAQGLDLADFLLQEARLGTCRRTPVQLRTEDIVSVPVQTNLGADFSRAILLTVDTRCGGRYDLLFDANGERLLDEKLVVVVNAFFEKCFQPGYWDGAACFISTVEDVNPKVV